MISERAPYPRQFNPGNHANISRYSIESHSTYFSAITEWSVSTRGTLESYVTASSNLGGGLSEGVVPKPPSPWLQHLDTERLLRSADEEINWSGKGQHVEFSTESEIPLVQERVLGHRASALVDSVRCRRVRLARKSIRCSGGWKKEDFLEEVKHLNRLRHAHIIQLVGTYVLGKTLAILVYPVADYTLDAYMDECNSEATGGVSEQLQALERFPLCLAGAVDYVHSTNTKHMDIKPTNILICSRPDLEERYVVYIADFGISRNYTDARDMETDGPMSFTRRYCAPEVSMQETRGKSADTFSLGCVFAEIFSVLAGKTAEELLEARQTKSDTTFHNNIDKVLEWIRGLTWSSFYSTEQRIYPLIVPDLIKGMLQESPQSRPNLEDVGVKLCELNPGLVPGQRLCCLRGPEQYRVAE
jgi:serine/threonine protein kinase